MGYHIDPVISGLEEEIDKLRGGSFGVDREKTMQYTELAAEILGDILPVRHIMGSLPGAMTNPLVQLMGMENYYCSMYDCPEELHQVMDMACTGYEEYYDFLERGKLLLRNKGISAKEQESFAFTAELQGNGGRKTEECGGILEVKE